MNWLPFIAGGFLCGSIPFSWVIGRMLGVDLRRHGSGNPGATNLLRTCGMAPGIAGLFLDVLKGAFPVYAAMLWGPSNTWLSSSVVVFAILGNVFSPWFGFRGGKGVATALGSLLVLAPLPVLCGLGVFLVLVAAFRMISLGSVLGGLSVPAWGFVFGAPLPARVVMAIVAAAILFTHRSNIGRIVSGTERKLGSK